RIEQRALQRAGAPDRADLAQVGRDARALGSDAMAARTLIFLEQHAPPSAVARLDGAGVEGIHVAKVRHDLRNLRRVELEAHHAGPGNASRNHAREILIGRRAAEAPAAKIDAAHAVSIRTMTRRALRAVQLRSVRDVGRCVLGRLDRSRYGSKE